MTPLAKGMGLLLGMPVVLSAVFFAYFSATGEDRMKQLCRQVSPGMTQAQLQEFAQENRLNAPDKGSNVTLLGNSRSYGQHACKITLEAGTVKLAEYSLMN